MKSVLTPARTTAATLLASLFCLWYAPSPVTAQGLLPDQIQAPTRRTERTFVTTPAVSVDLAYGGFDAADVSVTNNDGDLAVVWTGAVGVSVSGNSLGKNAATGWGNARAVSAQSLAAGDGAVSFTAIEANTHRMLGLSNDDGNRSRNDIDFGVYLTAGGTVQVYEAGGFVGDFGSYATGDSLQVAVTSGVVTYARNGTVFYASALAPNYPLLVATSLHSQGATLTNVSLTGPWNFGTGSRGYLTTPQELATIKQKADAGIEPYASAVTQLLNYAATTSLPSSVSGTVGCSGSDSPAYLARRGAAATYSYALRYRLTGETAYAMKVVTAIANLQRITGFVTSGDCPLTLGRHIPDWVRAADLIDGFWSATEKRNFQNWLASRVYPVLMLKYRRGNNWGAMITNAGNYIADYLYDRDLLLQGKTPAAAYQLHKQTALDRMNGYLWDSCGEGMSMIRPDGGIPDEIRRTTSCSDTNVSYDSSAHHYSEGHIGGLVSQAELLWRRGDSSLYDNMQASIGTTSGGKPLPAGRGSLRNAVLFIADAPNFLSWQKKQTIMVAARYYRDAVMVREGREGRPHGDRDTTDHTIHFTTLTHDWVDNEDPAPPPTVAPPGASGSTTPPALY